MDRQRHHRLLATLHIIAGIFGMVLIASLRLLSALALPLLSEWSHTVSPLASQWVDLGFQFAGMIGYIILFTTVLPSIVGAIGLVQNKSWAIYLLVVSGCIRLVNFPLGTALGVYTLWVFINFQKQPINDQNQ